MTAKFTLVKYGHYDYKNVKTKLTEIAGHFDISSIKITGPYSLHTEYSFGKRKFTSSVFETLLLLKKSTSNGIPLLWHSDEWSSEFYRFLKMLIGTNPAPEVIEIHPPFRQYSNNIEIFLARYSVFENLFRKEFPKTDILLENRYGTLSHDKFLVEQISDIPCFFEGIKFHNLKLGFVLDIPQLILAGTLQELDDIFSAISTLEMYKMNIKGIHLWGNDKRAHVGKLSSLFGYNEYKKDKFLSFLSSFFDDGIERYLVPEVSLSKQEVFDEVLEDLCNNFEIQ